VVRPHPAVWVLHSLVLAAWWVCDPGEVMRYLGMMAVRAPNADTIAEQGSNGKAQQRFRTLLAKANDFDLVDGTFVKIGDRTDMGSMRHNTRPKIGIMLVAVAGNHWITEDLSMFSGDSTGRPTRFRKTAEGLISSWA